MGLSYCSIGGKQFTNFSLGHEMGVVVPGAGLEPATFGCLRHHKGLARHTIALEAAL